MKTIVVVLDGLYDEKINGKTPLQLAEKKGINLFMRNSKNYLVKTSYDNLPVGSIVANMGILGYNPKEHYSEGRAIYEVIAKKNISEINENDLIFRLNYVFFDEKNNLVDFTAGCIDDNDAKKLTDELNKKIFPEMEIIHGKSYRNSLIIRNTCLKCEDIMTFEPHMNKGKNINDLLVKLKRKVAKEKEVKKINDFILNCMNIKGFNESIVNGVSVWGQSYKKLLPKHPYIKKGIIITGSDFLVGLGKMMGLDTYTCDNFTGEIVTDLEGKFEITKRSMKKYDFVFLHINSLDEISHIINPTLKKIKIDCIDTKVIVPLYNYVKNKNVRVIILGDHYTSSISGKHLDNEVPVIVWQKDFLLNKKEFSEDLICKKINSYDLIK
jgi:2,3-bisphosphoglycerate-independent phosphoglycerate mutase